MAVVDELDLLLTSGRLNNHSKAVIASRYSDALSSSNPSWADWLMQQEALTKALTQQEALATAPFKVQTSDATQGTRSSSQRLKTREAPHRDSRHLCRTVPGHRAQNI